MTQSELNKDLAFLRTVAEAGRDAPYIGGREMVGYGGLTALAFLGHWSIEAFEMSRWAYPILWIGYGGVMGIMGSVMRGKAATTPGAGAYVNRVDSAVWASVSIAIVVFVLGTLAHMVAAKDPKVVNWILPVAFSLYGAALYTSGKIGNVLLLLVAAFLSFASAFGAALLVDDPNIYLYASIAIIVAIVLPGMMLASNKPKSVG